MKKKTAALIKALRHHKNTQASYLPTHQRWDMDTHKKKGSYFRQAVARGHKAGRKILGKKHKGELLRKYGPKAGRRGII